MDYTISLTPTGNEVTTWNVPAVSCGDFVECHAEPPTCDCPRPGTCEASDTVSDADFGYWDEKWGRPTVQEFRCQEPATETAQDPYDGSSIRLCGRHAR